MTSDPILRRYYNWANREWFGGELSDVTIYWEPTEKSCAQTHELDGGEKVIRIDPSMALMDKNWKLAVAHELVHVKLWPYKAHGPLFDAEMQRLCTFRSYRKLL